MGLGELCDVCGGPYCWGLWEDGRKCSEYIRA